MPTLPITANLAARYRENQGITSSSNFVSRWNDVSGNERHFLQATGTNQSLLMPDGSILCDGVDNFLKAAAFTLNQPFTVYLLFKQVTWTNDDRIFDGNTSDSAEILQQTTAPNRLRQFAGLQGATTDNATLDTYVVLSAVFDGAASLLQINNNSAVVADAGAQAAAGFTLGSDGSGGAGWSHIQVKEVIIYSVAHDAATRRQVVSYLLELLNPIPYVNAVGASRIRRR